MSGLKLEDPTVDVTDVEKYRLAFLMQFFVQHRRRFRFPRLRLQDLYQRVVKDPDATAFCDVVARILRFLDHGNPDICIDTVDQALDRFTMDKRTPYRINMQRHRNGKPVNQLGPTARAALLDNLIESVYDEQPDFNFTSGFNNSNPVSSGLPNGARSSTGAPASGDADSSSSLFGSVADGLSGDTGDFLEPEDVNVLIKAGQDAQGCSYYYMDDLRLYRERPQNGISSQWDVAVGPTSAQWHNFILSLSRNEKEYDLYCFLKQDLFELVKQSLDNYELHATNPDLDSCTLRAKESIELAEWRRKRGLSALKMNDSRQDGNKLPSLSSTAGLGSNGPKSASPAFSGGVHGACGVGSSGSASSAAPLTPSSARTPTSAPPATVSIGCLPPRTQHQGPHSNSCDSSSDAKVVEPTISRCSLPNGQLPDGGLHEVPHSLNATSVTRPSIDPSVSDPFPVQASSTGSISKSTLVPGATMKAEPPEQVSAPGEFTWPSASETPVNVGHSGHSCPSHSGQANPGDPSFSGLIPSPGHDATNHVLCTQRQYPVSPGSRLMNGDRAFLAQPVDQPSSFPPLPASMKSSSPSRSSSVTCNAPPVQRSSSPYPGSHGDAHKQQVYTFDPSPGSSECGITHATSGPFLAACAETTDTTPPAGRSVPPAAKPHVHPATAMVPPIVGVPETGSTLTQEQWENRKSKIAQLEKIHSTLSKSKSASTPGAVAAAAGAVLHQHRLQNSNSITGPLAQPTNAVLQPHANGMPGGVSTGPMSYPPIQRHSLPDGYSLTRGPVSLEVPPSDTAQREWDRLCMDYQREKVEPSPSRMHSNCRHAMAMHESTCCSLAPSDMNVPPLTCNMGPACSSIMDQHPPCQLSPRHFSTHVDGAGPPVVMVPPNNSNITVISSAYSSSTPSPAASSHNYRYMPTMNCHPDQIPAGSIVMGQKRPYYGSPVDSAWTPDSGGALVPSQGSLNDNGPYIGSMTPCGVAPTQRSFGLRPPNGSLTSSPSPMPVSAVVTSSTGGRGSGVGKAGGKKRKTAGPGRANVNPTVTTSAPCAPLQQPYSYGKTVGGMCASGPVAFNKTAYPSPYLNDPCQGAFHPHRSVYASASSGHQNMTQPGLGTHPGYPIMDSYFGQYPNVACGVNLNRSISGPELSLEGRRAMALKGGEMYHMGITGGTNGPCGPPLSGGRISSGCNVPFPSGPFGSSSMAHGYAHASDGSLALGCDMASTMRPAVSCTQHLTSASLASLARLSQLSGPDGSFIPSSTSSGIAGNSVGSALNSGTYPGRGYPSDSTSFMAGQPHQVHHSSMRGHPGALKSYELDSMTQAMPHSATSPSMHHPKFGSQLYHVPSQQQSMPSQPMSSLSPQQQQQQQQQSQQPPSIQVNNTFFNAQLNVQQMNYQHVSAPGSTGQMQIHFVQQQQHEQSGGPVGAGVRCSRPSDSVTRVPTGNSGPVGTAPGYYNSQNPPGPHPNTFRPDSLNQRLSSSYPNQSSAPCDTQLKSEVSVSVCAGLPAVSATGGPTTSTAGYGSTSVHIAPRTPHTIQYLPAVAPHPDPQHAPQLYCSSDSPQMTRPKQLRPASEQGSMDASLFAPLPDAPGPEATRQGSFSSNLPHSSHISSAVQQQQYQQQQLHLQSQCSAQSASQLCQQQQQQPSRRSTAPCSSNLSFDSSVAGSAMMRPVAAPHHSSSFATSVGHISGCTGEIPESGPPGWITDSTASFSQGSGVPHNTPYVRQHSMPPRNDYGPQSHATQVQQQVYRQQQFTQHQYHQQQQQQQQQMFMSSSLNNCSVGQVQFMMSASASSSSMTTSNVQSCSSTTVLSNDMNATSSSSSVTPRSSSTCNITPDLKASCRYDAVPVSNKRPTLPASGDEFKGTSCCPAPLGSQHMAQPGRASWPSTAVGLGCGNGPAFVERQLDPSYPSSYNTGNFTSGSLSTTVPSTNSAIVFSDPAMHNRDLLMHQHLQPPSACDPPGSLSQVYTSSMVP